MTNDYEKHRNVAMALLDGADERGGATTVDQAIAAAQVHATLALAAATRANQTTEDSASSDGSMTLAVRMKDND